MKPQTDGFAVASLILSLSVPLTGPVGPVLAIVFGHMARARIRRNPLLTGDGLAVAGLVLGYLVVGLVLVGLAVMAALVLLGPMAASSLLK